MQPVRADSHRFRGVDRSTPPERMPAELFQIDLNGDRRRAMSWQRRPGYRRLFQGSSVQTLAAVLEQTAGTVTAGSKLEDEAAWSEPALSNQYDGMIRDTDGGSFFRLVYGALTTLEGQILLGSGTYSDDQYAKVTILHDWQSNDSGSSFFSNGNCNNGKPAAIVRGSASGYYAAYINTYSITLVRGSTSAEYFGGTPTTLATYYVGAFSAGDVIELRALGSTLYVYRNNTLLGSYSDTAITTGKPGVGVCGYDVLGDGTILILGRFSQAVLGDVSLTLTSVKAGASTRRVVPLERDDGTIYLVSTDANSMDGFDTGSPEALS